MTRLLVIDTETGGLDPLKHSILSIAAVVWENLEIVSSIELKIWEGDDVVAEPRALAINGIKLDELKTVGFTPFAAAMELQHFVGQYFDPNAYGSAVLVGHNIGFDVGFTKRLFRLANLPYPKAFGHRTLDTASVLQFLMIATGIPLSSPNSKDAFEFFGVTPEHAHTAIDDATATAKMLTEMIKLSGGINV